MTQGIRYIGTKPKKVDNVAGTGLFWTPNAVNIVGDTVAGKLLAHPDVWINAPEVFTEEGAQDLLFIAEDQQAIYAASIAANTGAPVTPLVNTDATGLSPIAPNTTAQPPVPPGKTAVEDSARFSSIDAPNLQGMSKPDIAAYAQRAFGVDIDSSSATKKEAMIDQVVALRNARATHGQDAE